MDSVGSTVRDRAREKIDMFASNAINYFATQVIHAAVVVASQQKSPKNLTAGKFCKFSYIQLERESC